MHPPEYTSVDIPIPVPEYTFVDLVPLPSYEEQVQSTNEKNPGLDLKNRIILQVCTVAIIFVAGTFDSYFCNKEQACYDRESWKFSISLNTISFWVSFILFTFLFISKNITYSAL